MKKKKIILFGNSEFAEIAYHYFSYDSDFEVVAFCVHRKYINKEQINDLPLLAFEDIEKKYKPSDHYFFCACVYTRLNRLRTEVYQEAKKKGYNIASYISSKAFIWGNVILGEHCFIFEDNTIQPFVKLGNNIILWSGNHIGHHSIIKDNVFISSHVVISGGCSIGENCFMGVNSTINNAIIVEKDCLLSSASLVYKNIGADSIVKGKDVTGMSAKKYFSV